MLIPLGFLASSGGSAGAFELLETVTLTSTQSTVTFSGIAAYAATYEHLQIRMTPKTNRGTNANDAVDMYFNADTTLTNYASHRLAGGGTSGAASGVFSQSNWFSRASISDATTGITESNNIFGAAVVDILDFGSTTKNKTSRNVSCFVVSNSAIASFSATTVSLTSHLWMNTNAITSITLDQAGGTLFAIGSRFSLYGIKATA